MLLKVCSIFSLLLALDEVRLVLMILVMRDEIATTMRLLGVTKLDQLGPHLVCPPPCPLHSHILSIYISAYWL
jgi:hypothetical protein